MRHEDFLQKSGTVMKRNMLTQRVGSMLAIRQNTEEATEQDWQELETFLASLGKELKGLKLLVYTDGGTLTGAQRRRLSETLGQTHVLVSAVSDSIRVRFAGATIALFQRNYRQFSTKELPLAYSHLNLTPMEQRLVEGALKELEARLYPDRKK
jgi:hypothetical protein